MILQHHEMDSLEFVESRNFSIMILIFVSYPGEMMIGAKVQTSETFRFLMKSYTSDRAVSDSPNLNS